ncbi:uncharacterized protein BO97DRAFT_413554 [Aspergillus homomorphus CBS 101889]|uniref:Uncharacterized protein n=1 Tax=Aspergillus homomorphus (strain CBS 101889) TaxID=1450537 RepID=A0A395HZG1_ASPHC|nr:hypothetical protein BO97DRAFT_413554 [Aspergillus homomorphus CBS 101889]RAL13087.1 hypothetical protein BO97DRAFT_413554 [Aspergillus homomorphus CBS 101889]
MSSFIHRTIRNFFHSHDKFSRDYEDLELQREAIFETLWETHKSARDLEGWSLGPDELEGLSIVIIPLDLTASRAIDVAPDTTSAAYFVPLRQQFIEQHAMDVSDARTQKRLDNLERHLMPRFSMSLIEYESLDAYSKAGDLCSRLHMEMSTRRLAMKDGSSNLSMITRWRRNIDFFPDPAFTTRTVKSRDGFTSNIHHFYGCSNEPTFPHIKLVLQHSDIVDPEQLLKAEVLAITATMHSRLCAETLRTLDGSFVSFLVMVFTFAEHIGRILTAIHDGEALRISMSAFYNFQRASRETWNLFARYLGGDINRHLSTKKVPIRNVASDAELSPTEAEMTRVRRYARQRRMRPAVLPKLQ